MSGCFEIATAVRTHVPRSRRQPIEKEARSPRTMASELSMIPLRPSRGPSLSKRNSIKTKKAAPLETGMTFCTRPSVRS